jgi:hypothetical protein
MWGNETKRRRRRRRRTTTTTMKNAFVECVSKFGQIKVSL